MEKRYSNFRGSRVIQVIEVHVNEGQGIESDAVYREVYYTDLNGNFLGKKTNQPLRQFADVAEFNNK